MNFSGGGSVILQMTEFSNSTIVNFAYHNVSLPSNTLKYSIWVRDFPFRNTSNQLGILISQQSAQQYTPDETACGKQAPTQSSNNEGDVVWVEVLDADGRILYGTFSEDIMIDGKLGVGKTKWIGNGTVLMTVPFFSNDVVLDPNYVVLVQLASSPSSCSPSGLSTLYKIVISICAFIIATAIVVAVIMEHKRKILKEQAKEIFLKRSSVQLHDLDLSK